MTDDLKERLLPCPYCAGEAHIYTTSQDSDTSVTAQCKECGAEMNFWLPWTAGDGQKAQAWQDVMNRWNTRAPDPRITDLEARLAAAEADRDKAREYAAQARIRENKAEDARVSAEVRALRAEAGEDALAEALRITRERLMDAVHSEFDGVWSAEDFNEQEAEAVSALAAYEARRKG